VVAVLATVQIFSQSLRYEAARLLSGSPELIVQQMMAGRHHPVSAAMAEEIRKIPGVGRVSPRVWGYYFDALTGANYTLLDWRRDQVGGDSLDLLRGRMPGTSGECAVGRGVADSRGLELGDDLIMVDADNIGESFQVTGIFSAPSNLLTNDLVVLPEADLRHFFGMPQDQATDLVVRIRNEREVNTVAAKIKTLFPASRPITRQEVLRTYDAVFDWRGGMLLLIFSTALLAFIILIWNKGSGLSAEEKREIGILKAIGWDTHDVLLLKFFEGLLLSLAAFLSGLLLAYGLMALAGGAFLLRPLKGWSVLFPSFRPEIVIDPYSIATLAFLAVVPYLAATILPSWKAAVTDPDLVMRH